MVGDFDPYHQWLGLPAGEGPGDHYRLLGIARFESNPAVISDAADRRMARIRRYQTGPRVAETQQLLNELSAAKLCLTNPASRAAYDEMLLGFEAADVELTPSESSTAGEDAANRGPIVEPLDAGPSNSRGKSRRPYYQQSWFPCAALGAIAVVAGFVWFVGQRMRQANVSAASGAAVTSPQPDRPRGEQPTEEPLIVAQEALGNINLSPSMASLAGDRLRAQPIELDEVLVGWTTERDQAQWVFDVHKPPPNDIFRVTITYASPGRQAFELSVAGQRLTCKTRPADHFVSDQYYMPIPGAGPKTLTVTCPGGNAWQLKWIELSFPSDRTSGRAPAPQTE